MTNALDRFLLKWAPGAAKRRARDRFQARSYIAAEDARARGQWAPMVGSGNTETLRSHARVLPRALDAVMNDPLARRIVQVWTAHAVGAGVVCTWNDERHNEVWREWIKRRDVDAAGAGNLGSLETLAFRTMVATGGAIVRFVPTRPSSRNRVGLRLQVLEGEHLDSTRTGIYDGRRIIGGVEVGDYGEPVAFWLYPTHPGETWPGNVGMRSSVRVPAAQALHLYHRWRPGMVRDTSWLAPVLPKLRDLMEYDDALLMKAKIEACLAAIVMSDDEDTLTEDPAEQGLLRDADGKPIEEFYPGMIAYRRGGGAKVESFNPASGGSHAEYSRRGVERASVGTGLTYEEVSGDLSRANYSSLKAGKSVTRRLVEQVQEHTLIPMLCQPIADEFHRFGAMAGLWSIDSDATYEHTPPAMEMVDPAKDTAALIAQVRAGFVPQQYATGSFGFNFRSLVRAAREANALADDAGLAFDSDGRRLNRAGTAHDPTQIAAIEIAATGAATDTPAPPAP